MCTGAECDGSERRHVAIPPSYHSFTIAMLYKVMCDCSRDYCIVGRGNASVYGTVLWFVMVLPYPLHLPQETSEEMD